MQVRESEQALEQECKRGTEDRAKLASLQKRFKLLNAELERVQVSVNIACVEEGRVGMCGVVWCVCVCTTQSNGHARNYTRTPHLHHSPTRVRTHTQTQTHRHKHTHTHTHTHTCVPVCVCFLTVLERARARARACVCVRECAACSCVHVCVCVRACWRACPCSGGTSPGELEKECDAEYSQQRDKRQKSRPAQIRGGQAHPPKPAHLRA